MTATSWPSPISVSARSRTWATTPPGTSQGYGDTSPTLIRPRPNSGAHAGSHRYLPRKAAGIQVVHPDALQHVPILRMLADAGGEAVGDRLGHRADVVGPVAGVDARHLGVEAHPPVTVVPEPQRHRYQRGPGVTRQRGRTGRHPRGRTEEVDLDPRRGQITVAEQAQGAARAQPLGENREGRSLSPGERDDLHAE